MAAEQVCIAIDENGCWWHWWGPIATENAQQYTDVTATATATPHTMILIWQQHTASYGYGYYSYYGYYGYYGYHGYYMANTDIATAMETWNMASTDNSCNSNSHALLLPKGIIAISDPAGIFAAAATFLVVVATWQAYYSYHHIRAIADTEDILLVVTDSCPTRSAIPDPNWFLATTAPILDASTWCPAYCCHSSYYFSCCRRYSCWHSSRIAIATTDELRMSAN
jgi:hypothetical protein